MASAIAPDEPGDLSGPLTHSPSRAGSNVDCVGDAERSKGGLPTPVSIEALTSHVLRLAEDIERAWSAALSDEVLDQTKGQFSREWSALLQTVHARAEQAERDAEAAGLDPTLKLIPGSLDSVSALNLDAGGKDRWHQLQLAQLVALQSLVAALTALDEPSAERVHLMTQESEQWWESGAFGLVRSRALLLARVARELDLAEAELFGKPRVSPAHAVRSAALDELQAANSALRLGDPEAALVHGHAALRLRLISVLELDSDELDVVAQPGKYFSALPSLHSFQVPLCLLDKAVERIAQGEGIDIGVSIPLAYGLLPLVSDLAFDPPRDELLARGRPDHAGEQTG
jgi:hypothetical protein